MQVHNLGAEQRTEPQKPLVPASDRRDPRPPAIPLADFWKRVDP